MEHTLVTAAALIALAAALYMSRHSTETPEVSALRMIHNAQAGDVDGEQGRAVSIITATIFLVVVIGLFATLVIW